MSNHVERLSLPNNIGRATLEREARMRVLFTSFTVFCKGLVINKRARSFSIAQTFIGIYFDLRPNDPEKVILGTFGLLTPELLSAHVIECSPEQVPPGRINVAEVICSADSENPKPKVILNEHSITREGLIKAIEKHLPRPRRKS